MDDTNDRSCIENRMKAKNMYLVPCIQNENVYSLKFSYLYSVAVYFLKLLLLLPYSGHWIYMIYPHYDRTCWTSACNASLFAKLSVFRKWRTIQLGLHDQHGNAWFAMLSSVRWRIWDDTLKNNIPQWTMWSWGANSGYVWITVLNALESASERNFGISSI